MGERTQSQHLGMAGSHWHVPIPAPAVVLGDMQQVSKHHQPQLLSSCPSGPSLLLTDLARLHLLLLCFPAAKH